jgi:hypothetical protein
MRVLPPAIRQYNLRSTSTAGVKSLPSRRVLRDSNFSERPYENTKQQTWSQKMQTSLRSGEKTTEM